MVKKPDVDVKLLSIGEVLEIMSVKGMIGSFIEMSVEKGNNQYMLTWKGWFCPNGAIVDGHEIASTQHGVVRDPGGTVIGYYERIIEGGGEDKKDQSMLVAVFPRKDWSA